MKKTAENDFDKAVECIVKSDFNKNLNKCLDIVKELDKKDKEIERLNNIIKEVREYIESYMPNYDFDKTNLIKLLEILKGSEQE